VVRRPESQRSVKGVTVFSGKAACVQQGNATPPPSGGRLGGRSVSVRLRAVRCPNPLGLRRSQQGASGLSALLHGGSAVRHKRDQIVGDLLGRAQQAPMPRRSTEGAGVPLRPMPTWYAPKHIKSFSQAPDYLPSLGDENWRLSKTWKRPRFFPPTPKLCGRGVFIRTEP
jgi:hypothetical protein